MAKNWVEGPSGLCPHPALRATFSRAREKDRRAALALSSQGGDLLKAFGKTYLQDSFSANAPGFALPPRRRFPTPLYLLHPWSRASMQSSQREKGGMRGSSWAFFDIPLLSRWESEPLTKVCGKTYLMEY